MPSGKSHGASPCWPPPCPGLPRLSPEAGAVSREGSAAILVPWYPDGGVQQALALHTPSWPCTQGPSWKTQVQLGLFQGCSDTGWDTGSQPRKVGLWAGPCSCQLVKRMWQEHMSREQQYVYTHVHDRVLHGFWLGDACACACVLGGLYVQGEVAERRVHACICEPVCTGLWHPCIPTAMCDPTTPGPAPCPRPSRQPSPQSMGLWLPGTQAQGWGAGASRVLRG